MAGCIGFSELIAKTVDSDSILNFKGQMEAIPEAQKAIFEPLVDSPTLGGRVSIVSSEAVEDDTRIEDLIADAKSELTTSEFKQIKKYIDENRWAYAGETVHRHSEDVRLPRSLSFYSDGTVYIHLNKRVKDELIGKGASKRAKFSINYDTKELCVRATGKGNFNSEVKFFDQIKGIPCTAKLYHSQTFISKQRVKKTEMIMPLYSSGTLSNLPEIFADSEALSEQVENEGVPIADIKKQFSNQILKTVEQLHDRDLCHLDLHANNIFLGKTVKTDEFGVSEEVIDPIIADFGRAKINASPINKLTDTFFLYLLFSKELNTDDNHFAKKMESKIKDSMAGFMAIEQPTEAHLADAAQMYKEVSYHFGENHPFAEATYDLMESLEQKLGHDLLISELSDLENDHGMPNFDELEVYITRGK